MSSMSGRTPVAMPGSDSEQVVRARGNGGCHSDFDCSFPTRCIRAAGSIASGGVCGRLVNDMGMPVHTVDNRASGCSSDFDCPMSFRCQRTSGFSGVCVRRG